MNTDVRLAPRVSPDRSTGWPLAAASWLVFGPLIRPGHRQVDETRDEPLANSNSGNGNLRPRLSTARAANEPRRRSKRPSRPTAAAASRWNVVLFFGGGNHGAEGIRTDGHRGFRPSRFVAALSTRDPNLTDCWVENVLRRWTARKVPVAMTVRQWPREHRQDFVRNFPSVYCDLRRRALD
jgi:hypothetical protein